MSAPDPASKRQRVDGEGDGAREGGLVIVSNVGDRRPEEIVPDTVATYCLNCSMSVRSYVVVPDFGPWSMFLANYKREGGNDRVEKRYVKKMIPDTVYLKNITCDVMMLCCLGIPRFKDRGGVHHPHALCFNEGNGFSWRKGSQYEWGVDQVGGYVDAKMGRTDVRMLLEQLNPGNI
jgi:hypothetical protein